MKALNFLLTIGDKNISHKAVKSFEMDRNFSDVANKFSITLVDHPSVALTDLELYMAQGYRSCVFSYSDSSKQSKYQKFSGQIWDYDCTFVGDMKQLTVTGYASRSSGIDTSGSYTYNIDWNSYYNRRADEDLPWNCLYSYSYKMGILQRYSDLVAENKDEDFFLNSATSSSYFLESYNRNSLFVTVKGPVGTIALPIPDSFTTMEPYVYKVGEDGEYDTSVNYGDIEDPDNKFWGTLTEKTLNLQPKSYDFSINSEQIDEGLKYMFDASNSVRVWLDKDSHVRAFQLSDESQPVIQLNPKKKYFGAGQLLYSQTGVDISYIVRQLCILEGWTPGNIVQTELVPCDDKFKMQNQTALQFIQDVLVPSAVTPVGEYTLTNGETKVINQSYGGFHLYWTDEGKVNFEPISDTIRTSTGSTKGIKFGYNVPNSPVISFKVDTKGTSFYTVPADTMNSMTIATGVEVKQTVVSDKSSVENLNKTKGHSEALDSYFGYTYEEIDDLYGNKALSNSAIGWVGFSNVGSSFTSSDPLLSNLGNVLYSSDLVQKGLVNQVPSSAISGDTATFATLNEVIEHITNFTIQATMNLWADADLCPNTKIEITNMVKRDNSNEVIQHPTSGTYLIWKQKDSFADDQYIQQLSLLRYNDKLNINPEKINWSKSFKAKEGALKDPAKEQTTTQGPTCPNQDTPVFDESLSLDTKDEAINAATGRDPNAFYNKVQYDRDVREGKINKQNTSKSSNFGGGRF